MLRLVEQRYRDGGGAIVPHEPLGQEQIQRVFHDLLHPAGRTIAILRKEWMGEEQHAVCPRRRGIRFAARAGRVAMRAEFAARAREIRRAREQNGVLRVFQHGALLINCVFVLRFQPFRQ